METPLEKMLRAALKDPKASLRDARRIRSGSGCDVWDLSYRASGSENRRAFLKIYTPDFDDYSQLGPARTARKSQLAAQTFPAHGISAPRVIGTFVEADVGAILSAPVHGDTWNGGTRRAAALALARLHVIDVRKLPRALHELVASSTPNRRRVWLGVCGIRRRLDAGFPRWRATHGDLADECDALIRTRDPDARATTLVHGDYFRSNLIAADGDVYVVDWDLLALGDPMWDLAFLVSAEPDVPPGDVEDAIDVYRTLRTVDEDNLRWHRRSWSLFWRLRALLRTITEKENDE